jgi:hypothetical protein
MPNDECGALLREFPQTFTFKNWPFMAFLLFLGSVLALPAWLMGNTLIAFALIGAVLVVPALFFLVLKLVELRRATLLAIYENGLSVRFQGEAQFVPWGELTHVLEWRAETTGPGESSDSEHRFFEVTSRSGVRVRLGPWEGGRETLDLVLARTRLTPEDLGFRRWR